MDASKWGEARRLVAELDALATDQQRSGIHDETDDYLELNGRVNAALAALPWWQRLRFPMMLANAIRPPVH